MRNEKSLTQYQYFLAPGYIYLARSPTIISTVLGSGVSVCVYDKKKMIGAMNCFLYPEIREKGKTTALYGNVATIALIRLMLQEGSKPKHLVAQILGGAYNQEVSKMRDVGSENVRVARKVLSRSGIKIISEDVGGTLGRKVVYDSYTNEVAVLKVERLRQSDWYPYEGSR
ncbi:MAG: chemotaxis protein CheD [Desulfatiglandales bacterium]